MVLMANGSLTRGDIFSRKAENREAAGALSFLAVGRYFGGRKKRPAACESEEKLAAAGRGGVVWPLRILLDGSCSKGGGDPIDDCEKSWRAFWELGEGASWSGFFIFLRLSFLRREEDRGRD